MGTPADPAAAASTSGYARQVTTTSKVVTVVITAVLFAAAKGITGYIPSPWGVGQLYIAAFVPLFFAIVSDTMSVAVGAAMGSFIGDMIFLLPVGATNPLLALAAGVPANFVATLLFGWAVKKYRSWPSFITSTVAFLTLGNLMAAGLVATAGPLLFAPLAALTSLQGKALLTLGLTVFWDTTSIPAVLIVVPVLLRAVRPISARSTVITDYPSWSSSEAKRTAPLSVLYALIFLVLAAVLFLVPWGGSIADITPIKTTIFAVAAILLVVGPLVGRLAGGRVPGRASAAS
ncbi:MAG: hypothetical protein JRM73_00500 [Nitrososphaerota archaeon]|nr:hypothetical protein [Nitrososphaerota archaeon]